jgi:DNA-binding winged helix-turn-helix (wHTH) protein
MHKLVCGQPVSKQFLVEAVYGTEQAPTSEEPLGRLLERLRKKLRPCGLVIRRITRHGYLLTSQEEQTVAH